MSEPRAIWSVEEAVARFEDVVDRALADGPQTIVQDGREAVVVLSVEQWERMALPAHASSSRDQA